MNERALILNAIKQKKENTSKVDFDFPEPDVMEKWAKKKKRLESFKGKSIDEWSNVDFLHYLDFMLKEFGVVRARENTRRDSDRINHLHDQLVEQISSGVNNHVLKEYLEWWCSIWAPRLTGSEFHLNLLIHNYQVSRFANRYKKDATEAVQVVPAISKPTMSPSCLDDENIYDLGGLSLLLMKRGLVIGHRVILKRGISSAVQVIQDTVKQFSREVLINVLKITLQESPYLQSDKVDFIALVQPALSRFGLTEYTQVPYGAYFKD